jgi:hypothetical protein
MLAWEAVMLTHSSAGAVVATLASSVAAAEGDADGDDCAGDGSALALVAVGAAVCALLAAELAAVLAALEPLDDGLGEGDGDGDGDAEGEGDGEAVGVGVPGAGITWQAVSVLAAGAACAVPSAPRLRKLPLSKVTAATLTCAKRIRIACLRCSSGLPCAVRDSEATRGQMGTVTHFPQAGYICITRPSDHSRLAGWTRSPASTRVDPRLCPRQHGSDGLGAGSVP